VALNRPAKYLVNVGSVGQNRDQDPRACYTIFDTYKNAIEFRRISYDVRATQKKILAAGLPKVLAWRLELRL
jgi:diadenosine tetraphosphatase ApaH/serine/threonine PP2A family protein phosphatase